MRHLSPPEATFNIWRRAPGIEPLVPSLWRRALTSLPNAMRRPNNTRPSSLVPRPSRVIHMRKYFVDLSTAMLLCGSAISRLSELYIYVHTYIHTYIQRTSSHHHHRYQCKCGDETRGSHSRRLLSVRWVGACEEQTDSSSTQQGWRSLKGPDAWPTTRDDDGRVADSLLASPVP